MTSYTIYQIDVNTHTPKLLYTTSYRLQAYRQLKDYTLQRPLGLFHMFRSSPTPNPVAMAYAGRVYRR